MKSMQDQTVLITGATDGLGRQVAQRLAKEGASLLVHGRNRERAEAIVREISDTSSNGGVQYYLADFSSLVEVRNLADEVRAGQSHLDLLINNAGVILPERQESKDGVELTFAINYLSHFLLTRLLLPLLRDSAPARIVNVASVGQNPINFDDVMLERNYEPMKAYRQSKLAMIMDSLTFAGELEGTQVSANALHPATLMDTKMVRESFGGAMSNVEEGTEATVYVATSPDLEGITGCYFDGKTESRADGQAYDREARERLHRISEELTGL